MASQTEHDTQAIAARYLAGEIPLHQLEDEILPILWEEEAHSPDALQLAGAIQAALAEMSRGDRSLESMRAELASALGIFENTRSSAERLPQTR